MPVPALSAFQPASESAGFPAPSVGERALDLVHLSRQTLGDRALEVELLQLFECQANQTMQRLASVGAERRWSRDLAHTLKGSARAIGATRVANAAHHYEELLFSDASDAELAARLNDLGDVVAEARAAALAFVAEA